MSNSDLAVKEAREVLDRILNLEKRVDEIYEILRSMEYKLER